MDDLAESIGKLSTSAKEWKPGQTYSMPASLPGQQSATGSASEKYSRQGPQYGTTPAPNSPASSSLRRGDSTRGGNGTGWRPQAKEFIPSNSSKEAGGAKSDQQDAVQIHSADDTQFYSSTEQQAYGPASDAGNPSSWWTQPNTVPAGAAPAPSSRTLHSFGISDELWRRHRALALESRNEMDPSDPRYKAVPASFIHACPLDYEQEQHGSRSSFGYPTSVFKVISSNDGYLYCLRRVDSVRCVSHKIATTVMNMWANAVIESTGTPTLDHPGLVRLYRCFLSQRAVFFVHHYHSGAETLRSRFFDPATGGGVPLPEPFVWSCVTQLVSAIRAVHSSGLACRSLQLNHILCIPDGGLDKLRLRINCIGVVDALEFEARKPLEDLQKEDMYCLGQIILSLATGTEICPNNSSNDIMNQCTAFIAQNYSQDLLHIAESLVRRQDLPSVHDVSVAIASRAFDELDATNSGVDGLSEALSAEYESGRSFRLLLKLAFINERPEFGIDKSWSESGDCYVLKLFRDYVFHQADGSGRPVLDLGHVTTALNKLDSASEEKIVLTSRDGQNLLVVTFADVSRCLEGAFAELCAGSVPPQMDASPFGY